MPGRHRRRQHEITDAIGGRRLAAAGAGYSHDAAAAASGGLPAQELVDGLRELLDTPDTEENPPR